MSDVFQARMYTMLLFNGPPLSNVKVLNGMYPLFRAGGGKGAPFCTLYASNI